jgi:hypothetical protein
MYTCRKMCFDFSREKKNQYHFKLFFTISLDGGESFRLSFPIAILYIHTRGGQSIPHGRTSVSITDGRADTRQRSSSFLHTYTRLNWMKFNFLALSCRSLLFSFSFSFSLHLIFLAVADLYSPNSQPASTGLNSIFEIDDRSPRQSLGCSRSGVASTC